MNVNKSIKVLYINTILVYSMHRVTYNAPATRGENVN